MEIARLTFNSTHKSADAFYIAGMVVADAFIGLAFKDKFYAVASALELGNFRKYSRCDEVFSWEALEKEASRFSPRRRPQGAKPNISTAALIATALKKLGAKKVQVGADFPAGLYNPLKKIVSIEIADGALFPERAIKSAAEQNEIRKANLGCAAGIALCADYIHRARVVKGRLIVGGSLSRGKSGKTSGGQPLTSEFLRVRIQELFLRMGLEAVSDLIIAGGRQACDPHCLGIGALKPRELIIVDLFAPLQASHYWGDMSRTFIKGTPTGSQARLVETVAQAQRGAIRAIHAGVVGREIHEGVVKFFKDSGYETKPTKNGYEGFFHGTGHALGLECHDNQPYGTRLNSCGGVLRIGEVVTVEPGLYYPAIGGCRIEDNGVVTKSGFKLLSHAPYDWVL